MSIYIIIMVIYSKDTVMVQIVMLEIILINENTLKCRTLATYWTVIWA